MTGLIRYLPALLLVVSLAAPAQERLEVIDLRFRTAAETLPLLRPLIGPDGTVTGYGFQLIVRADSSRMDEIRDAVRQLDQPPVTLDISVYQGHAGNIGTGRPSVADGYDRRVRETRRQDDQTHRVRVLEGRPTFIATGEEHPIPFGYTALGPAGSRHIQGTEWRPSTSGFYALPRVNGKRVTLEIQPFSERADSNTGIVEGMQARTTVSGRLGEWIPVADMTVDTRRETNEPIRRRSTLDHRERQIWLRVEVATQ